MPLPLFPLVAGAAAASAGGGGGGLSLMALTSTTGGSTLTIPGVSQAGDIIVMADWCINTDGAALPASVTPPGFTLVKAASAILGSAGYRLNVTRKVLIAGDPGSTITGMSDNRSFKYAFVFRPSAAIATITASTWNGEITAGDPSSQSVLASGGVAPLIVFGMSAVTGAAFATFNGSAPSSFTAGGAVGDGSATNLAFGNTIYNSGPIDHTIDKPDEGTSNGLVSGYLQFA